MRGWAEFRRHLEAFAEFVFIAASSGSGDVMKSNEAWKHFVKSASFKEAIENFPESVKAIPESAKSATVAEIREVARVPGRLLAEFHVRGLNAKIPAAPAQVAGEAAPLVRIRKHMLEKLPSLLLDWHVPGGPRAPKNPKPLASKLVREWMEKYWTEIIASQPPATPDHEGEK